MSFFADRSSVQRRCLAAACAAAFSCVLAPAAAAEQRPQDRLDAYTVVTSAEQLAAFEAKGLDVADSRVTATGVKAQMILTRGQVQDVRAAGASAKLTRVKGGKTVKQFAAAAGGERVHRLALVGRAGRLSATRCTRLARDNPQLVKLEVIGTTLQGREIIALKVTAGRARQAPTAAARRCCTAPPSTRASGSRPRSTGA